MKRLCAALAATVSLLSAAPAADTAAAEALLREGKAAETYALLRYAEGDEALFWRGRALVNLHRLEEAAQDLRRVSPQSPLHPYAAKALLYCAWQCPALDFPALITPLTTDADPTVATPATAALAEYWLLQDDARPNTAHERLRALAAEDAGLQPLCELLDIVRLRRSGQLDEAERRCREMEQNRALPTAMRHRARLALAEIFYAREAAETDDDDAADSADEDDSIKATAAAGTGEEALLHFVAANPDSPLLPEAVRRLFLHHAFDEEGYARNQLRAWGGDVRYPRRAAIALYLLHQLTHTPGGAADATHVNTALATCPREIITEMMALEQANRLIERGEEEEAARYLRHAAEDSPRRRFLAARLMPQEGEETARAYIAAAESAAPALRCAALHNALLCALRSGDDDLADEILSISPGDNDVLLALCIGYHLQQGNDEAAAAELQSMAELTDDITPDVQMDRIYLALQRGDTASAYAGLSALPMPADIAQQQRCFALMEEYCHQSGIGAEETLAALRELTEGNGELTLFLIDRYAAAGYLQEAQELLQEMMKQADAGSPLLPNILYRSARVNEQVGTLASLKRAIDLYEHCAATDPQTAVHADIRRAALLARIGRTDEALQLLPERSDADSGLPAQERVLYHMVRATIFMLRRAEGDAEAAVAECAPLLTRRGELSRTSQFALLLHHGALCSRLGKDEEALADYLSVLAMKSPTPGEAEWNALYTAAAGAVTKSEELGRYEQAAELADRAAAWHKGKHAARSARFEQWAAFLRQTHFLNTPERH